MLVSVLLFVAIVGIVVLTCQTPEQTKALSDGLRDWLSGHGMAAMSKDLSENSFQVLLCVDGDGGLETPGRRRPMRYKKGECIFLPAGLGRCHTLGEATFIKDQILIHY